MNATYPLYAISGLALAAVTLTGLVWWRARAPQHPDAGTDYAQLFSRRG